MKASALTNQSPLFDIINRALTSPETIGLADMNIVEQAFVDSNTEQQLSLACASLIAMIYSRPTLVNQTIVPLIQTHLGRMNNDEQSLQTLSLTLSYLIFTKAGKSAVASVLHALTTTQLNDAWQKQLLIMLREAIHWHPELIDLEAMLTLSETPSLGRHKDFILNYLIERLLFVRPMAFNDLAIIEALTVNFNNTKRFCYTLAILLANPDLTPSVRNKINHQLTGQFRYQQQARNLLIDQPINLMVLVNSRFGQGDEIVRVVTILDAILAANSQATVTLITKRPYLYDHPRIDTISINSDEEIANIWLRQFQGVLNFYEAKGNRYNWRSDLQEAISNYINQHQPPLVIAGDHLDSHFCFQILQLNAENIVSTLALDHTLLDNIYEPSIRLLCELGLPLTFFKHQSIMIEQESTSAMQCWQSFNMQSRKTALLNPFGGAWPEKGYMNNHETHLLEEITALVDEGFHVLLIPNGTPWGRRQRWQRLQQQLPNTIRQHTTIAPDPGDDLQPIAIDALDRPELGPADRVMRWFKYFAEYADLIITVEGWMSHLAYVLGRPFRLLLMPHSYPYPWLPYGRNAQQTVVMQISNKIKLNNDSVHKISQSDEASSPLPRQPYKAMLQDIFKITAGLQTIQTLPFLYDAMSSADYQIRYSALAALAQASKVNKVALLTALTDQEKSIRGYAAAIISQNNFDCSQQLGANFQQQLSVHQAIDRDDWAAIKRLGTTALPALAIALKDREAHVRTNANQVTLHILHQGLINKK